MPSLRNTLTAILELGPRQAALFAAYQVGKRTGFYRWRTQEPPRGDWKIKKVSADFLPNPDKLRVLWGEDSAKILAEAERILDGHATIFGELSVPLDFSVPDPLKHWAHHETPQIAGNDIKFYWEPARFGWAMTLVRAYLINRDIRYSEKFYALIEDFMTHNPAYIGPHWANGQEVALRMLNMILAHGIFQNDANVGVDRLDPLDGIASIIAAQIGRAHV